ncbi:MAG: helix-turn-helix transcriptional regulator [Microscillaceae bacterium]|jgi:AraC-like DNA-binding protein|nr:helix-turn-helix transcriptional regulator [Microscillaceae bacterium]
MLEVINLIILFGVIQGFVLSWGLFLLAPRRGKWLYYLAIFSLVLVYNGLETLNWSANWQFSVFSIYTFTPIFALGPAMYFYIQSIANLHWSVLNPQNPATHFSLFYIQFLVRTILFILFLKPDFRAFVRQFDAWQATIIEPLSWFFTAYYFQLSNGIFRKYTIEIGKNQKYKTLIIKWLAVYLGFIKLLLIVWACSLAANMILPPLPYFSYYYPTEILLVALLYWLGFTSYHQSHLLSQIADNQLVIANKLAIPESEKILALLKNAMEADKIYLDNELTVNKLAKYLQISPKTVSAILNQHLQKGFNDFINEYRVEEVKLQMLNPDNQHLTISGIALEAGFNSQATFQRVFKNQVGMTPSEYLALEKAKINAQIRI